MINKRTNIITYLLFLLFSAQVFSTEPLTSIRSENIRLKVEPVLKKELLAKNLNYGAPIFIRIFKDPGVLEVWVESENGSFVHFKDYDICTFSGYLGPKQKEGDRQSPEGFYFVTAAQLNPWSSYHLSFNLGYPNKYDRLHGRTGSALMVHGHCVSIGCYAMTNRNIDEIYTLAAAALKSGQPFFRVHSFPFELESKLLSKYQSNPWYPFWLNLKEGYDYFNHHKRPPDVGVLNGQYTFSE